MTVSPRQTCRVPYLGEIRRQRDDGRSGIGPDEHDVAVDRQVESPATDPVEAERIGTIGQAPPQREESRFEVVVAGWETDGAIQADFSVRELCAARLLVFGQH